MPFLECFPLMAGPPSAPLHTVSFDRMNTFRDGPISGIGTPDSECAFVSGARAKQLINVPPF